MARLRPAKSVVANFRRVLPRLLRRYFRQGRRLTKSRPAIPELHRFRIRTKRIRYITELYAELFPGALLRALAQFRGFQQILGSLQDQSMVAANFERSLTRVRASTRQAEYLRVLHRARRRQDSLRDTFLRRWTRLERSGFEKRLLAGIKRS